MPIFQSAFSYWLQFLQIGHEVIDVIKFYQIMQHRSTFAKTANSSLYNTSNKEYGGSWAVDGTRGEKFDMRKANVPTYSEIVDSLNDFKKAERLIKSKVIKEKMESEKIEIDQPMRKTTEFPIKTSTAFKYPEQGLRVGPSIYQTSNMSYGNVLPSDAEIPSKYNPRSSSFTKGFNGGNYKFNGLNTVKTNSNVHQVLNDI